MKFSGKLDDNTFLIPPCKEILSVKCSGQEADIECFMTVGHDGNHGGGLYAITPSKLTMVRKLCIANFYWNELGITSIQEQRDTLSFLLAEKIPAFNKTVLWPCDCKQCHYFHGREINLQSAIISLNDGCKWGRTPEENSEHNIIDWLDSLDLDFEVQDENSG